MDERDLHSSSIGIFTDDSSEGIHLELKLLTLWNINAAWNRFDVQVDRQRTIRIHRSRSLRSHIGFLCLAESDDPASKVGIHQDYALAGLKTIIGVLRHYCGRCNLW